MSCNAKRSILCTAMIVAVISVPQAFALDYALMVQQTPLSGGTVTPGPGVHTVAANGQVTVSATPKSGYQFVSWLGDVGDASAATTTVNVDSPKIVVAVFERSDYEEPFAEPAPSDSLGGGGSSGGDLRYNPTQQVGTGSQVSAGSVYKAGDNVYNFPSQPGRNGTNGTDGKDATRDDGIPTPTPEPVTAVFLGMGALALLKRRK